MKTCSVCGLTKSHIRSHRKKGGWSYVDDNGSYWSGTWCPTCANARRLMRGRAEGKRPIDEVTSHEKALGRRNERVAAKYLEGVGYTDIRLTVGSGPDIRCRKDGREWTVEVKTACRRAINSWRTGCLGWARRDDDLVAIVFPHEHVVLLPMKEYLTVCDSNLSGNVTRYRPEDQQPDPAEAPELEAV